MSKEFHLIPLDTDIILHCDDFMGDYTVEGQIKIKYGPKGIPVRKFCRLKDGKWFSDFKNWQQRTFWKLKEFRSNE